MSTFWLYLVLGFEHISTWQNGFFRLAGYDHLLFLLALVALYTLKDGRKVLILVTAFTLGHSLTLALATVGWVVVDGAWIEFLIPTTILLTAIGNLWRPVATTQSPNVAPSPARGLWLRYGMAAFFGLIHGLGFSNFLRELLGAEQNLFVPLLAFNIGLELGQLLIVSLLLLLAVVVVRVVGVQRRDWVLGQSVVAATLALQLMIETFPVSNGL